MPGLEPMEARRPGYTLYVIEKATTGNPGLHLCERATRAPCDAGYGNRQYPPITSGVQAVVFC
jgi:hypothetical protein